MISRAEVDPDLLSGRVMKSIDPDVESDDQVSLNVVRLGCLSYGLAGDGG